MTLIDWIAFTAWLAVLFTLWNMNVAPQGKTAAHFKLVEQKLATYDKPSVRIEKKKDKRNG